MKTIATIITIVLACALLMILVERIDHAITESTKTEITAVTQDISTINKGQHCMTTAVFLNGTLIRMLMVYDLEKKNERMDVGTWFVVELSDSVKKAQYELGEDILKKELSILIPYTKK